MILFGKEQVARFARPPVGGFSLAFVRAARDAAIGPRSRFFEEPLIRHTVCCIHYKAQSVDA